MQDNHFLKLEKYIKIYLNEKKSLNLSKNTLLTYSNILNDFSEYYRSYYEELSLEKITKAFIISFLDFKGLSPSSKNLYSTVLKNFFTYLEKNSYTAIDIKKSLSDLNHKVMKRSPEALTQFEYDQILQWFEKESSKKRRSFYSYRNAFIMKLLLLTGVRASELLSLKAEDFTAMFSKEDQSIFKIKIMGKGNKERYVYILKESIEAEFLFLQHHLQQLNQQNSHSSDIQKRKRANVKKQLISSSLSDTQSSSTASSVSKNHLCMTKEGRVLLRSELYLGVNSFLKHQGISKRGVHMLRHSFGKYMVRKNINLSTIKDLMGHENIQTTMIYARSDEESMIRAVV